MSFFSCCRRNDSTSPVTTINTVKPPTQALSIAPQPTPIARSQPIPIAQQILANNALFLINDSDHTSIVSTRGVFLSGQDDILSKPYAFPDNENDSDHTLPNNSTSQPTNTSSTTPDNVVFLNQSIFRNRGSSPQNEPNEAQNFNSQQIEKTIPAIAQQILSNSAASSLNTFTNNLPSQPTNSENNGTITSSAQQGLSAINIPSQNPDAPNVYRAIPSSQSSSPSSSTQQHNRSTNKQTNYPGTPSTT